jgi:hypothetical protein
MTTPLGVECRPADADVTSMHFSVRLLVVVLGTIAVGWLLWKQRRDLERRPKTIAAVAIVVFALGVLEYRAQAAEQRFGKVVSKVAKRDVGVRCQGMFGNLVDIGQELGTVRFDAEGEPADYTDIKRDACKWLKKYEKSDYRVTYESAVGVHVLAHEAIHLRGWTDEALTECYGLQYTASVARSLGAPAAKAQALAEFYWRVVYPEMPDEYRSPDCANGAKWDLDKNSDVWPTPKS